MITDINRGPELEPVKVPCESRARNNRPGEWACDDVEAARLRANELSRLHGLRGPTPDEVWNNRDPITCQTQRHHLDVGQIGDIINPEEAN